MRIKGRLGEPSMKLDGTMVLPIITKDAGTVQECFDGLFGKDLSIEVKRWRERRSLDANAYLWVLLQKMAEVLHSSKDEMYLEMLDKYGQFTFIIVRPDAVERMAQNWRTVRVLGEVGVDGQCGVQMQCFYGSSTYDTREMAVLIDGVVSECKELGIETLPPDELAAMKDAWAKTEG